MSFLGLWLMLISAWALSITVILFVLRKKILSECLGEDDVASHTPEGTDDE